MAILINGVRQLYKPKIITYPDTTLFGEPSLIKFKDSNEAIHYLKGYYNGNLEYETMTYLAMSGVSLTQEQQAALDANIKSIKYGSGIVLSSLTAKLSLVSGYYFVTQSSVDLRPYALIPGVQFSFSDGSKTAVYSGTMTAGTGETLGSNIYTNNADFTSNEPPGTAWLRADTWVITGGVAVASATNGSLLQGSALTVGALYKEQADISVSSGTIYFRLNETNYIAYTTSGAKLTYRTSTNDVVGFVNAVNFTGTVDNALLKQVLTPSATGFLSSTRTVESGFDPNAASFTVTITRP